MYNSSVKYNALLSNRGTRVTTDPTRLERVLKTILGRYLPDVTDIKSVAARGAVDFVAHRPSGLVIGEVRQSGSASIDSVLGLLARGVLRSRNRVSTSSTTPLVLAIVPRVGARTERAVHQFMSENAADCGWALTDQTGATRIVIPSLGIDVEERGVVNQPRWQKRGSTRLFSDLNRWMLKVLLLAHAPPNLWNGPRANISNATELHRVAMVSVAKAHQFCDAIEKSGFLVRGPGGLTVVRKKMLMETWFHNERARRTDLLAVRSIFDRTADLHEVLCRPGIAGDFAVSGFEACRLLGILHASVIRPEVYVIGDLESALDALDLEVCDERDAQFFLRKAQFGQSILRGRLVQENLPIVDVLQAALDVCDQAARGAEQAEYIVNHVLGWEDDE